MNVEDKIRWLESEVTFWRDQRNLAANVAATIADLDEEAPALRQLLRQESARRKAAEDGVVRLAYQLECAQDRSDATTVELIACAWDLVNAAEKMRMHWAETTDPGQRNRELWTPLHTAADVLRDRLDLVAAHPHATPEPTP